MAILEERSSRSSSSSSSEKEIKTIYFRVVKYQYDEKSEFEWYVIDTASVGSKPTLRLFSKMPHSFPPNSVCVSWEPIIYVLGGGQYFCHTKNSHKKNPSPEVFYLDVRCPAPGWKKGPPMSIGRLRPYAAVIDGKIYVFGDGDDDDKSQQQQHLTPWGEVLDPLLGEWKDLPRMPGKFHFPCVCTHAVLNNNGGKQFLVHPISSKSLYLYDVEAESWSLFEDQFGARISLKTPCAVVDDIMFCFSRELHAYDLVRRKWFSESVKGLEGRGVSPPLGQDDDPKAFLVHVGNGRLCLVWHGDKYRSNDKPLEVHCTRFRISKHSDGEEEHKLHAIIESFFVNTIDNVDEIEDCLAL